MQNQIVYHQQGVCMYIDLHGHTYNTGKISTSVTVSRGFHYFTVCLLCDAGAVRDGKQLTAYVPGSCIQQLAVFQPTNHLINSDIRCSVRTAKRPAVALQRVAFAYPGTFTRPVREIYAGSLAKLPRVLALSPCHAREIPPRGFPPPQRQPHLTCFCFWVGQRVAREEIYVKVCTHNSYCLSRVPDPGK